MTKRVAAARYVALARKNRIGASLLEYVGCVYDITHEGGVAEIQARAVGRKPGWVNWATRFVKEKRGS